MNLYFWTACLRTFPTISFLSCCPSSSSSSSSSFLHLSQTLLWQGSPHLEITKVTFYIYRVPTQMAKQNYLTFPWLNSISLTNSHAQNHTMSYRSYMSIKCWIIYAWKCLYWLIRYKMCVYINNDNNNTKRKKLP